jgi:radical SAM protein with 4Fe4S-binding SPASM domain
MTVNPRGEVSPCCVVYEESSDFGNLVREGLSEVWNNEHYRASRALFSRKACDTELQTICHRCPLFRYAKQDVRGVPPRRTDAADAAGWTRTS